MAPSKIYFDLCVLFQDPKFTRTGQSSQELVSSVYCVYTQRVHAYGTFPTIQVSLD